MRRAKPKSHRPPIHLLLGVLALAISCGPSEQPIPHAAEGDADAGLNINTGGSAGSQASTGSGGTASVEGTAASGGMGGSAANPSLTASSGGTRSTNTSDGVDSSASTTSDDSTSTGGIGGAGGAGGTNGTGGTSGTPGESCDAAEVISEKNTLREGPDFTAAYGGDLDLEDDTCHYGDDGSSDAVFAVSLEEDETLVVSQAGELEVTLAVQAVCGAEEACLRSERGGNGTSVDYTAEKAETVFVVVDATLVAPSTTDYAIHIDVNPRCGNGVLQAREECDDGGVEEGDGCSPTCTVEFPWMCTPDSPTECELPESLGEAGAGDTLTFNHEGPFEEGPSIYRIVDFTEPVLVDVEAISNSGLTGDIDIVVYSDWDEIKVPGVGSGNAWWPDAPFELGTYLIELRASTDLPDGFKVTLTAKDRGSCGDAIVQSGFEECDNGNQAGCEDCKVAFDHVCDGGSPSVCTPIPNLGVYEAGETIAPVISGAEVLAQVSEYRMIEFSEAVILTATATPNGAASYYLNTLSLWSKDLETEPLFTEVIYYYPTVAGLELPKGIYKIELVTYTGLPEGFTLTLETAAP